jgi:hypothetical protein
MKLFLEQCLEAASAGWTTICVPLLVECIEVLQSNKLKAILFPWYGDWIWRYAASSSAGEQQMTVPPVAPARTP